MVVDEHEAERAQEQGDGEEPRAPGIELRLHFKGLRVAALGLAVGAREHREVGAALRGFRRGLALHLGMLHVNGVEREYLSGHGR